MSRRPAGSKILINKLRTVPDVMEKILRDNGLKADVQIADIEMLCWAVVQLAINIKTAVDLELSDLEGELDE